MLQDPDDLNDAVLAAADGEEVPIRELRKNITSGPITAFFTDLEVHLADEIRKWPCVVGCMAWLTDETILQALAECREVNILVQKEDLIHPGYRIIQNLKPLYNDLKPLNRVRAGLSYNTDEDPTTAPVRCVGRPTAPSAPLMHHKFLVFCDYKDQAPDPKAVWTGSFNATETGAASLQNAVLIRDANIAAAYYNEWGVLLGISEPCEWTSDLVCPEYRIGA
jgi:hypothetical protein